MLRHADDGRRVWSFGTTCNSVDSRRRFSAIPVISQRTSGYLSNRMNFAMAIYRDTGATLDDLREAVTTLEDGERLARRVLGGAHPSTEGMEEELRNARAALRAREAPLPPRVSTGRTKQGVRRP